MEEITASSHGEIMDRKLIWTGLSGLRQLRIVKLSYGDGVSEFTLEGNHRTDAMGDPVWDYMPHVDKIIVDALGQLAEEKKLNPLGIARAYERAEEIVDAIGKALNVDTGTVQENIFSDAINAAQKVLKKIENANTTPKPS